MNLQQRRQHCRCLVCASWGSGDRSNQAEGILHAVEGAVLSRLISSWAGPVKAGQKFENIARGGWWR